jgi:arylsulfatase A-like enzyme
MAAATTTGTAAAKALPPHIVLLYADDLGYNDLGVIGEGGGPSASPHIDALTKSGVLLNTSYVYVWCAPSRGALMTGRLAMHNGYMCGGEPGAGCAVPLGFKLMPEHLKQRSYSTHHIGKWHLGMRLMAHLPISRGFDTSLGYLGGGEDYYTKVAEGGACTVLSIS